MKRYSSIIFFIFGILTLFSISNISNAQEGFFCLGDLRLEIRSIALIKSILTIKLKTQQGEDLDLDPIPLLSSDDFEGIEIADDVITLYVKNKSWVKTKEATSRYLSKRLAFIVNGEIISTPVIRDSLSKVLQVNLIMDFKIPLERLKSCAKPSYFDDLKIYESFLKDWLIKYPADYSANHELLILYLSDSNGPFSDSAVTPDNCEKSIPLLQRLINIQPDDKMSYPVLSLCYLSTKKFDEALKVLKTSIDFYPENEKWLVYKQIASVYQQGGLYDEALKSLDTARTLLLNSKLLPEGVTIEMIKNFNLFLQNDTSVEFETIEEFENHLRQKYLNSINSFAEEVKKLKDK